MLSTILLANSFFKYLILIPCYFLPCIALPAFCLAFGYAIYLAMNARPPRPSPNHPCPKCAAPVDLRLDRCPGCDHVIPNPSPSPAPSPAATPEPRSSSNS